LLRKVNLPDSSTSSEWVAILVTLGTLGRILADSDSFRVQDFVVSPIRVIGVHQ
jgi:hypothetical protein